MQQPVSYQQPEMPPQDSSFSIDYKRVIYQALRFWYLIVLSVVIALTISYVSNRYKVASYAVDASIIIKEGGDMMGGKSIYSGSFVQLSRNYLNEIYIIKSIPLIERTVHQLKFEHAFFRIGNILDKEYYKSLPLQVEVLDSSDRYFSFHFEVIDNARFRIYGRYEDEGKFDEVKFGDTITWGAIRFRLIKTSDDLSILETDQRWFYQYTPAISVAGVYVGKLSATWAEEGAGVINLSVAGPTKEKERDFMRGLIRNYQDYDLEKKNQASSNTIEFINKQLSGISDSLNQAERKLELFKTKNIITDLNSEALRLYQKIEGVELQKTELLVADRYFKYLDEYIKQNNDLDRAILPSSIGINDAVLGGLLTQMIELQTEIKINLRSDKLSNPLMAEKQREIEEVKKSILELVENQKSINKIKFETFDQRLKELEVQVSYLPMAERQLVSIKRNYSLLENLYIYLLQKRAEAGITRASNTTDIVVVNPPQINGPISSSALRSTIVWLSIGLIIPILIIVIFELLNTKVQSREDVEKITTIPFLGGVGHKSGEQNLEVFERPRSSISESFRALRSNLSYFLERKEKGVFMITSSVSGEGKTFTSINLAAVFALSGKKTLIVGADMRKPRLFNDLKLTNDYGLSNYLSGIMSFNEVIQKSAHENLDLISGGPVPPNPSELLLNNRMTLFLEEAKANYDFIFIDTPPLALVTDAFVLSSMVDHTLFIIRQNVTPKSLLRTIDDMYRAGKMGRISIVLNDIYKSGPGYGYGYGYAYGYGYGYGTYGYGRKKKDNGQGYYED